jgi:hypothetical protein
MRGTGITAHSARIHSPRVDDGSHLPREHKLIGCEGQPQLAPSLQGAVPANRADNGRHRRGSASRHCGQIATLPVAMPVADRQKGIGVVEERTLAPCSAPLIVFQDAPAQVGLHRTRMRRLRGGGGFRAPSCHVEPILPF